VSVSLRWIEAARRAFCCDRDVPLYVVKKSKNGIWLIGHSEAIVSWRNTFSPTDDVGLAQVPTRLAVPRMAFHQGRRAPAVALVFD
jgi:hypothetical protein